MTAHQLPDWIDATPAEAPAVIASLQAARAALGLAHSHAKPNYGAIFDAYDAACDQESAS